MTDQVLGLIGIIRKASALVIGEDRVLESLKRGRVKILILPLDAGQTARRLALSSAEDRHIQTVEIPYTAEVLSHAIGLFNCQIAAVTDLGLAKKLTAVLAEKNPDRYASAAEAVSRRYDRQERRKRKKPGLWKKKKSAGEE